MPRPTSLAARETASRNKFAVIGGRLEDNNAAIYEEMHRLSGGRILIFSTASSEPEEVGAESLSAFEAHGFDVALAPLYSHNASEAAFDENLLSMIADYKSVYFTGGDQAKIYDALIQGRVETPALKAIRAAHNDGGLLAGSSAGAAIMSNKMLLGGTSLEAMVHGVTDDPDEPGILIGKGLGFFPFGFVDQHFIKRGRLGRLVVAMSRSRQKRGFGIDENTALIVEDGIGKVCGEYGVFTVDLRSAKIDAATRTFEDFRLSYLDDGDTIDLKSFRATPGHAKRRVRASEMAYRAQAHSRRNAFGAYALYDLIARLVLGDQSHYATDEAEAFDVKSGVNVGVHLRRVKGGTRCLIAKPISGLRMTGINFRCSLTTDLLGAAEIADRDTRRARTFGVSPIEQARIILLGSSPLYSKLETQKTMINLIGKGPVGIFAAASAEARQTASEHVTLFRHHDIEAIDLDITIDTVEYAAENPELLDKISKLQSIFLCGGNQIRLVETLLHRGEESAVLRAFAHAYANGATLVASSGGVSAMSGVMIAGGDTYEALRYGVASDVGHKGLVIEEGVGLFGAGICDQNIIKGRRLGRLVIACAEENERFGVGVCEDSAVISTRSDSILEAAGRYGFVLIDIVPQQAGLRGDHFVAQGIRLTMLGPGDAVDLKTGAVTRRAPLDETSETLNKLTNDLMREGVDLDMIEREGIDSGARHAVKLRIRDQGAGSALLDLECSRDEYD